jgi:hypothetical protein
MHICEKLTLNSNEDLLGFLKIHCALCRRMNRGTNNEGRSIRNTKDEGEARKPICCASPIFPELAY